MANTYKNTITSVTSTGSDVAIYTSPSDATTIINTIFIYNGAVGTADYTIYLTDTSASTTAKIYFKSALGVAATDTVLGSGNVVVLEDSDILKINTTAQPLDVTISAMQITRS